MLLISIAAVLAYALVIARCIWFAANGDRFRQDDRTEVAFIIAASCLYMFGHIAVWAYEPWKFVTNSGGAAIIIGFTLFTAAYFWHRIGALMIGRDRRVVHRRLGRAHG